MNRNDKPVSVIGTGVCTPVGINTIMMSTGVAVKDAAFQETSVSDLSGEPVKASLLSLINKDANRTQRICFLAESAVEEVMFNAQLPDNLETLDVFIGLPEPDGTYDSEQIKASMQRASETRLKFSDTTIFATGRSGFFHALDAAKKALNNDEINYALVGSADSMCDPESLLRLVNENRLLNTNINGLLTGEGAGCFFLTSNHNEIKIIHTALSQEPNHFGHEEPGTFSGLSTAFGTLRNHLLSGEKRVDYIFTSQTGEDYWNREFTSAYLRNTDLMPEPITAESIVESHGDIGAATGSIMLAAAINKKDESLIEDRSGRVLIYGSSDNGSIGACIVEGVNKQKPDWFESGLIKNHLERDAFFEEFFKNHIKEIGWLILSRHRELHELKKHWADFTQVEQRLSNHLEAIVIAGSTSREHACQNLEDSDNDIVSGAVYTIAALAKDTAERDNLLNYFSKAEPCMINIWTLTLKHSQNLYLDELPEELTANLSPEHQTGLTEIMAYRGTGDKDFLISQISKGNQEARNYAATALSRMTVDEAKNELNNIPESQCSIETYLALILLDDQNIVERCREAIQDQNKESADLPLVIALAGTEKDSELLLKIDDGVTKFKALGISGLGKFIPILMETLNSEDPEIKKHSAESLERITSAGLTEIINDPDFDPEIDDEPDTTTEISKNFETWNLWWQENQNNFEPNTRYRQGKPFSLSTCLTEIENSSSYEVRQLAAIEINIRSGKKVYFEADAFEDIQKTGINLWKQGR